MEKNLLLDEYWTDMFKSVYEHIKHDCDPEEYDNGWSRRGLIVADDESDSCIEPIPVSSDSMYDILGFIFRYSIWHYMELLKRARKGDEWAK